MSQVRPWVGFGEAEAGDQGLSLTVCKVDSVHEGVVVVCSDRGLHPVEDVVTGPDLSIIKP